MSCMTKIRSLISITKTQRQHLTLLHFSTLSPSSNRKAPPLKPHKTQQNPSRNDDHATLFNEITQILSSGDLDITNSPSGYSQFDANLVGFAGKSGCTTPVCGTANEKSEGNGEFSVWENTQMENLVGNDVSGVVHKITEIVRGSYAGECMEERLDESGCEISSDVVCMVLKRCFKVPHLAMRFFDWVKSRNGGCLSTESYNTMLYLAGEAKEFELVERLVEEMENYGCRKDIKTWSILLMHYGKAKMVGKALLVFEKMRRSGLEPDAEAYRLVIRSLCESKKGDIALEFYKEMVQKGMELDSRLYKLLLNCLAGYGDIDGVYLVADDMIKLSQIPEHDVYCSVMRSLCVSQRIREALELIRDLKNKNLTIKPEYFEILVKGLCRADKMDDALDIVEIMKKKNVVSELVYGDLISGFLRKNDSTKALDMFHVMKDTGFAPSTRTYTELMQHLFDSNQYEKGCSLFDEMLERGVELDAVAYTAVIAGHVRNNDVPAAWKLLERMEGEGIRATPKLYSTFIKELCKSSKTHDIIKVLYKMEESKINIGKYIFHIVISYMERKKEVAKLEEVIQIQRHCSHYSQEVEATENDSSNGRKYTGEPNNVSSTVDHLLPEPPPRAFSDEDLHNICTILSSSKDWPAMQEALENRECNYTPDLVSEILRICGHTGYAALQFFSWVGKQPGYRHSADSYNVAIKLAGRGKDFEHMRSLFYEMQRNRCLVTSDTWTIMIMLYGRVGLTDIALRNFNEMKTNGFQPTTSTYKYLILSLCGKKGRNVEEAIKLFKEMINSCLVPDKEMVDGFFECLCQVGKLPDAKKCLGYLQKGGFTTTLSYCLLIRALCRRGNLEEALSLVNEVKEDQSILNRYVSGSLVHAFLKKGKVGEALAKMDLMRREGIHPTVHVYTSFISHFCQEKQIDKAVDILNRMLGEGCYPTTATYSALIRGYLNVGNVDEAQKLFFRMRVKGPFPDFRAYSMMIAGLCEMGRSEAAIQYLSEMSDDGIVPSTVNFRTVFFGLNREGKQHLAETVMQQKRVKAKNRKFLTS